MSQILDSPEAVLTTLDKEGNRNWMYPTPSHGPFWKARAILGWLLIVFFVALPWVQIGGRPAILLDLGSREFTFFGLVLHPTDTILLMVFLLTVLLSIYLFTALFGRVWCGWACPQTVYLEFVYRPIERLIEGKENRRKRRDQGPWNFDKAWRKGAKYAVFTAISVFLAHTFVAYFAGWDNLLTWMQQSPLEAPGYFIFMAFTSALVLFDFAYFREQMCTITCPYARFQSVLMDKDSVIVSYDPNRGEPRGTARDRKNPPPEVLNLHDGEITFGDCIDCGACVRTCPTGIDIREGLQMECIACTQCIDACDAIMDAIDKPRGLIRYTSENAIDGDETSILRPRLFMYGALLTILITAMTTLLISRPSLEAQINRASGTTYSTTADDEVANRVSLRLRNRGSDAATFEMVPVDPADLRIQMVGDPTPTLQPGELTRIEAWITVPRQDMPPGGMTVEVDLTLDGSPVQRETIRLLGPTTNS